jgi:ferredoxin-NADP reductase
MSRAYKYKVINSEMVTTSTLVLSLQSSGRRAMEFKPGQYAAISFTRNNRPTPMRCFSMTSSPTQKGILQFGFKIKGLYTKSAIDALIPGSDVIVEGPFGNFAYDETINESTVMIAAGIGVTPFIGMMRYATLLNLPNRIMLVYGCHDQNDIPFLQELYEIANHNPNLYIVFVLSDGPTDKLTASGLTAVNGHIDSELLDSLINNQYLGLSYFICGSPAFMHSTVANLTSKGVPKSSVKTEYLSQGQRGPKALTHDLSFQVYALTGLGILLGTGTTLLADAAKAAPQANVTNTTATQAISVGSNSRQLAVSNIIKNLKNPTTSRTPAVSNKPTSSSGGTNPSPLPNPTPSPTPQPTPSPSPSPGPPPPPPPPPVAPILSLSASPKTVAKGKPAVIVWSTNSNATQPVACDASGGWQGVLAANGSITITPTATATYNLDCYNVAGSSSKSVTINVCKSTPSHPC